jgi:uncharacterized repeat protein (TIGR01451 family)
MIMEEQKNNCCLQRLRNALAIRATCWITLTPPRFIQFGITAGFLFVLHDVSGQSQPEPGQRGLAGVATSVDTIEFSDLAARNREMQTPARDGASWQRPGRSAQTHPAVTARSLQSDVTSSFSEPVTKTTFTAASTPPSPGVSASFVGLLDDGTRFNPDTQGAVGPNHVITAVQSGMRIHDRSGAPISTVSLAAFWSTVVSSTIYDPRVLYDPYGQRWIHTAATDGMGNNPGLLVAVSVTSDPTGAWRRYLVNTDAGEPVFADSPNVGLTKDWITIQANLFRQDTFQFRKAGIWALNKTNFYAGGNGQFTFFGYATPGLGPANAPVPAVNYDDTYPTNFLVANWVGNFEGRGYLRLFSISGRVGAEVFNDYGTNGLYVDNYTVGNPPWADYSPNDDNFAPQLGSSAKIYVGDARIQNVVFRSGTLWCAQTVFLLNDGPQRSAVQWWEISQGSRVLQRGRVDDAGGVNFYAYPSIAVNSLNDVLLGFSRFGANQYPSANYAFHGNNDGPGNLRADTVLKAGEAKWDIAVNGLVRWGDWSGTIVDPINDIDFWTVQEYASSPVSGQDRWGTWWGHIGSAVSLSVTMTGSPGAVSGGGNVTYSIRVTNNLALVASGAKIADTLPVGAGFVSAVSSRGSCGQTNGVVICDFGALPENSSATVTIVAALSSPGPNTNRVAVSASGPDASPADDTATVITSVNSAVDIFPLITAVPNPPKLNSNFVVRVTVTNRGPSAATAVLLTNALPVGVTFVSVAASQGTCTQSGSLVNCSLGTLASMSAVDVNMTLILTTSAFITNVALVATTASDAVPSNNSTSLVTRAVSPPTISHTLDRTINEDTSTGAISFNVNDIETPAADLQLSAMSSDPALVPAKNIFFEGAGQNRTINLAPVPNQFGSALITIIVTDGAGDFASDSFVLTVNPVNDPPTLGMLTTLVILEDSGDHVVTLTGISAGPTNEEQTLTITATSSNPSLIPNPRVSYVSPATTGTLSFAPATNSTGSVLMIVTVNDNAGSNNIATRIFGVAVNPVNDPPFMSRIADQTINEDTSTTALAFTIGDVDSPLANLSVSGASSDPTLVPAANILFGGSGSNRTVIVTPATNQTGSATIQVFATDGSATNMASFVLTVLPVNDPPVLLPIATQSVDEDSVAQVSFSAMDPDNSFEELTYVLHSSNQDLLPDANLTVDRAARQLVLTPATNQYGSALVELDVTDPAGGRTNTTFALNVNPVNDPPTLDELPNVVLSKDASLQSITVSGITSGATNEFQNLIVTASSSDPSVVPTPAVSYLSPNAVALLTFTPVPGATGSASIFVTVQDDAPTNNAVTRSFNVTVGSTNHDPGISAIANQTIDEDTQGMVAFTVSDVETPAADLTVTVRSSNEELIDPSGLILSASGSDRTLTLRPLTNQYGSATMTLTVTDGAGGKATAVFDLIVRPVPDPPEISGLSDGTVLQDTLTEFHFTVNDEDTPPADLQVTATSSDSGLIPPANLEIGGSGTERILMVRSTPGRTGVSRITVSVSDGALVATETFNVTVDTNTPGPLLQIALSGTNVIVSWPTNGTADWVLQTNASAVTGAAWTTVGVAPSLIDEHYSVTLPATGDSRFFRLCIDCNGSTQPVLAIQGSSGGLTLSWAGAQDAFELESRDLLDVSTLWTTAPEQPVYSNEISSVTLDATGVGRVFRLRSR